MNDNPYENPIWDETIVPQKWWIVRGVFLGYFLSSLPITTFPTFYALPYFGFRPTQTVGSFGQYALAEIVAMWICVFYGLLWGSRKSLQADRSTSTFSETNKMEESRWASIFYRYVCYLSILKILVLFVAMIGLEMVADHTLPISMTEIIFDAVTPHSATRR